MLDISPYMVIGGRGCWTSLHIWSLMGERVGHHSIYGSLMGEGGHNSIYGSLMGEGVGHNSIYGSLIGEGVGHLSIYGHWWERVLDITPYMGH